MRGNRILDLYEIDADGDYVIENSSIFSIVICGQTYYPDTTETYDGDTEILFDGLDDHQSKIFALCVEGWV